VGHRSSSLTVPKTRPPIPKQLKERVLAEFNHRCAICGMDRPQIHHIDENPGNNVTGNLLPLCPNCHLVDQHNPTAPTDPRKLRLFRQYKDPVILSAEFHPLFRRFAYLLDPDPQATRDSLSAAGVELVAFVNALKMGGFYHVRIADLVIHSSPRVSSFDEPADAMHQELEQRKREYLEKLRQNREQVIELIIEMLRYQDWSSPRRGREASERAT
jgi:hypothetical protein